MLNLYDTVKLKKNKGKVRSTYLGAVVDILNNGEAYSIEFVDDNGDTVEDALFEEYQENELVRV